jgi:large subunit ribosomal protein L17
MSANYHPLGRKPAQRKMLLRNLVTSLILYEEIHTTKTRAKVMIPILERMITGAKGRPPHIAVRFLNQYLTDKNASRKTMEVLLPSLKNRASGFTRIAPIGRRIGDGAQMVKVSLLLKK